MTKNEVESCVRYWQQVLALTHWDLDIRWDEEVTGYFKSDTQHAYIWRAADYDVAYIVVNPNTYEKWTTVEGSRHIVHELLHVIFRDVESILDQLEDQLAPAVENLITMTFKHNLEGAIDRVAYRLVELATPRLT